MVGYEGPPISALGFRVGQSPKSGNTPKPTNCIARRLMSAWHEPRQIASRACIHATRDMEGRACSGLSWHRGARKLGFWISVTAWSSVHPTPTTDVKMVMFSRGQGWRARDCSDMNFEGEEGAPYAEKRLARKKIFEDLAVHGHINLQSEIPGTTIHDECGVSAHESDCRWKRSVVV
jgi:hypothetical protein